MEVAVLFPSCLTLACVTVVPVESDWLPGRRGCVPGWDPLAALLSEGGVCPGRELDCEHVLGLT